MKKTDTNDMIHKTMNTDDQISKDENIQSESYFFDETDDMTSVSERVKEELSTNNDTSVTGQDSTEFPTKNSQNNEKTPQNRRPAKSIPIYDLSDDFPVQYSAVSGADIPDFGNSSRYDAEERTGRSYYEDDDTGELSFSYADIPNFSRNIISQSIRELDDYYEDDDYEDDEYESNEFEGEEYGDVIRGTEPHYGYRFTDGEEDDDDAAWGTEPYGDYYFDEEDDIPLIQYADDEIDTAPAQTNSLAVLQAETAALIEKIEADKKSQAQKAAAAKEDSKYREDDLVDDSDYYFDETDELPQIDEDMFGTQSYVRSEFDGEIGALPHGMRPEFRNDEGMRPEFHGEEGMRPESRNQYEPQPEFQNLRHGLPVRRPIDHREAPDATTACKGRGLPRRKLYYAVTAAALALVILTGSIFGVRYAEAKAIEQEREYYASIGNSFVSTDTAIGEEALTRIVEERRVKDAEKRAEEERIRLEKEAEEERLRLEAEEKAREGSIPVTLSLTSMEKDLKIKFFNKETGNLITGVPFNVQVTDPSGNKNEYTNNDRDGIILKKELKPGDYKVCMLPFTEEQIEENRQWKEYAIVTEDQPVTVRDKVAYEKVDVSGEIKKESEVNVAKEDTAKHDTVVESKITDTVEWVESTKTEVPDESGSGSSEPTYTEVDRSKIADPYANASADGKVFFAPSHYLPAQVLSRLPGSTSDRFLAMAEGRIPTQTLRMMAQATAQLPDAKTQIREQYLQAAARIPVSTLCDADDSGESSEEGSSEEESKPDEENKSEQSEGESEEQQDEQKQEDQKKEEQKQEEEKKEEQQEEKKEEEKKEEEKQEEQKKEEKKKDKKEEKKEENSSVTIKAEPGDLVMIAGTAADIIVTIEGTDDKGFTVKSSDTNIAKAEDSGKITAVKSGSCKITVTSKADSSKTAEVSVTVKGEEKQEVDENARLKDTDGNQLYVLKDDGTYREAVVADYKDTNIKFYKTNEGQKNYRYTGWQTIEGKTYFFDKNGNPVTGEQTIQGAKYSFSAEGVLATGNSTLGIDVSTWNGNVDWNAVKASGVSYAIIRVGYRGSSIGALIDDSRFRTNISGAAAAGLKVGVYFYSQAVDEVEAVEEASMVLNRIAGYHISLPVFIDVESSGGRGDAISSSQRTANILAFCKTISSSGYAAGVYANTNWLTSRMNAGALTGYHIWLAQYAATPTYSASRYDLWQYTSTGRISGISGNVDLNYSYRSY